MGFPATRLRRLRQSPALRRMLQEVRLSPADLIQPFFVCHGENVRRSVSSMPGVHQLSVDQLVKEAGETFRLGVPAVILFGIPAEKDPLGKEAYAPQGVVQRAVRALKESFPELFVFTDLCFCEYTDHGHCGVVKNGNVDNDATLELLARTAVVQAESGADGVAPSGMMDGAVGAIRRALDQAGFSSRLIMAYAAKFASAFYGPFREAAGSTPQFGDRRAYQMDPPNAREALREAALDIEEGADIVMVKPALAYLDVIRQVKDRFHVPVAAYNVSGEFSMVAAAAANGWLDGPAVAREILLSIKRAGADVILTYHAKDIAQRLQSLDR
ncbi:MAG: porphobilinogen synthase [Elusimicrobia bacterium]|nr:porphobilinogen synthase [Elusimicrobiota bacterium]